MSNSGELTINNPTIGGTVTDGTVVWTVSKDLSLSGGIIKGQFYTSNSYDFVDIMAGPKGTYSGASLHLLGKDFGKGYYILLGLKYCHYKFELFCYIELNLARCI